MAVEKTTGCDDLHLRASHWALLSLDHLCHGWDQDGGWNITSMSTTFTTLRTDEIDTDIEAFLYVLGVADHVHVEDAGAVELIYRGLGRDTDSGDEQLRSTVNDDLDELVKLSFGVVVANKLSIQPFK